MNNNITDAAISAQNTYIHTYIHTYKQICIAPKSWKRIKGAGAG